MEPIPLDINPLASATTSKNILSGATIIRAVPEPGIRVAGRVAVLAVSIPILISLPGNIAEKTQQEISLQEVLSAEGVWLPPVVAANKIADQLRSFGLYQVEVIKQFHDFPKLEDRELTWHRMNWSSAMIDWFNTDISDFNYKGWKVRNIDTVLEVSIASVIGMDNRLLLEIYAKQIDAATGKVMGRARRHKINPMRILDLFENDGMLFKETFTATARELGGEILVDLGFTRKQR